MPSFILTKGERRQESDGIVTVDDILLHYERKFTSRFRWKGGPDNMPPDFMEKALYWVGGLGPVKIGSRQEVAPAIISLRGFYGEATYWTPSPPEGTAYPDKIMQAQDAAKHPMLYTGAFQYAIRPLCELMAEAYRCLNTTIHGLQQPVILSGTAGGELNLYEADKAVSGYTPKVYALDRTAITASVLDLGGKDHTQNLISTINALDCEILARMGIKSAGTEKASGVTTEETISITQELSLTIRQDFIRRQDWLQKVKDIMPGLSVEIAPELAIAEYVTDNDTGRTDTGTKDGTATDGGNPQRGNAYAVGKDNDTDSGGDDPAKK